MIRLVPPLEDPDHALGHPRATVTLVAYGDYECPHSAQAQLVVAELFRRLGDDLRFAFRHFPLEHRHPHALAAAVAAEAAGAQRRFWQMHDLLFENQDALERDDLVDYADALGLDVGRFVRAIDGGAFLKKVRRDQRSGTRSHVVRTPTFFVQGVRHEAGWDVDTLTGALQAAVAESSMGA